MHRSRRVRPLPLASTLFIITLVCCAPPQGFARQQTQTPAAAVDADATRRADAPVRALHVTVLDDAGNVVEGLKRDAFKVFDGGSESEIVSFSDADVPSSIAVVLDASGSMGKTVRVRNALLRFFGNCHAQDEFSLSAFNQGHQLLVERSNDPAAILSVLDSYAAVRKKGQTALYDALYLALNHAARGKHRRRAVLLVTDGQDNASKYTLSELRRAVLESDATIYAVGVSGDSNDFEHEFVGKTVLTELTNLSGGVAFFPRDADGLNAAMARMANVLRGQYEIGVRPAPAANRDGWHEVKVKVEGVVTDAKGRRVKPKARARRGFYDAAARD